MFEIPAAMLSWFYGATNSYLVAIALMSVIVMAITTPLTLKSTKGMLEMQKLSPEMRRLQNEHRNDKTKLNEEMMKLYQEHKVNPMSSCLPIFAQMPVFIVMFRILRGWTYQPNDHGDVDPIATATLNATGTAAESFPGSFLATCRLVRTSSNRSTRARRSKRSASTSASRRQRPSAPTR